MAAFSSADMDFHLMSDKVADGAVCLDGTPAALYFRKATKPENANDWIMMIQGGGWCFNEPDCVHRTHMFLGSSSLMGASMSTSGIMDADCDKNPDFCNFNHVELPYCDGNSFAGNRTEPLVYNGTKLYMRGVRNLVAALETLRDQFGMDKAENFLFSGESAGGLANYMHTDRIHDFLKKNAPSLKKYRSVPLSGYFLDHGNWAGEHLYTEQMKYVMNMQNSSSGVHQGCLAANPTEEWKCQMGQYIYPHIEADMFIVNSAMDMYNMNCILSMVRGPNVSVIVECQLPEEHTACIVDPYHRCSNDEIGVINQYGTDFVSVLTATPKYNKSGNGAFILLPHTLRRQGQRLL
eukprot:TRINITY_DN12565_c1_g2_i2.p1 TRINITY_DN12565_c1_g2~~TRINITY_DN12565_c1_g2_i2.p1  ORF type:complete len:374 (+),score=99.21 TRINITY_DN12565_c1_g2_i2:75-1124(+)